MVKTRINTVGIWCQEFSQAWIDGREIDHIKTDLEVQVSLPLEGNKNGTTMQDSSTFKNPPIPIIIILSHISSFRLVFTRGDFLDS